MSSCTKKRRRSVTRRVDRVIAPISVKCRLCRLFADRNPDGGVIAFEANYRVDHLPSTYVYICDDCFRTLRRTNALAPEDKS